MDPQDRAQPDERELRTARLLIGLGVVSALVAAAAGVILLVSQPASGSTLEGTLGFTAALAGFSTAGFAVAAMIYAQVKNLWRYVPTWFRLATWVVIAIGVAMTVWNLVTQAA